MISKGTKPRSWCWSYFERKEEKDAQGKIGIFGYCIFCNNRQSNVASRLEMQVCLIFNCGETFKRGQDVIGEEESIEEEENEEQNLSDEFQLLMGDVDV